MSWTRRDQERRRASWGLVPLALVLLAVWLLMTSPSVVRAHALLLRSLPEANTKLAQPPATIEMWFSEPLEGDFSNARLLNSLGEEVLTGTVSLDPSDPTHITLPLGQLEPGIYTVAWQTLSQVDGHEWFGSFPFTVLNPDGSRPTGGAVGVGDAGRGDLPTPGEIASRWLVLLGGMLFLGAPLFQMVVVPPSRKPRRQKQASLETSSRDLVLRAVWIAVLAIVLGSWLQIVLQALRLGDLGRLPDLLLGTRTGILALVRQVLALTGLFAALGLPQPRPLRGREWAFFFLTAACDAIVILLLLTMAAQTERALVLVTVALAGLGMALASLAPRQDITKIERRTWQALLVLAGVLLFSLSLGSHAGAVPGSVWAVLGDYIHLVAAAAWVGGLVLLPVLIRQVRRATIPTDRQQLLSLVRRFSYLASFAVFVLVVTGLFNSLVELPTLSSLVSTPYGYVLLVKLFLIVIALEVAFFNNRLVHRQARRLNQATGLRHFNRQVVLETIFSLGVMVSVAILVQTPAPRSLTPTTEAFQPDLPFNTITRADDLYVHVQVAPNQVGNNRFWVHLYHVDNSPIGEVQLVRLLFNYREEQLGQARADLEPRGRNTFAVEGAYVNQAGLWDLSVYVRRRGLDDILAEISLDVPPPVREAASANPWQTPIPALPPGLLIAGVLMALGAIPFIWGRLLRQAQPRLFLIVNLTGGIFILAGLVTIAGLTPGLLVRAISADELVPTSPDSIAKGATLYQENCAICHGLKGLGDGPRAASLEPPPANLRIHVPLHNDRELYGFISQGILNTAMPAFAEGLTSEERWHLANYLRDRFGSSRTQPAANAEGFEPAPLVDAAPFPGIKGQLAFDTPDGKLWVVPAMANPQRAPLFDLPQNGFAFQPVWSPDGSRVAYGYLAPPEPNRKQQGALLWVANADGTQARAVVGYREDPETGYPTPASYHDPAWSADSQFIWTTMEFPIYNDEGDWVGLQSRIGKISVDSGQIEVVVEDGYSPDPSPDGKMLAYLVANQETSRSSLWVALATGAEAKKIVDESCFDFIFTPRFSPEGKVLAFAASGEPEQCKTPNSTSRREGSEPANGLGRWFPDIFKLSPALAHGLLPADVWLIDVDGTNLTRLTEQYEDYPTPAWSADGRYIAFGGVKGLYLVEVQSRRIVRISNQAIDGQLDWSP